jgi:hypothetical protein
MKTIDKFTGDQETVLVGFHGRAGVKIPIFEARSYHKLNQLLGYAKYINRSAGHVYFRGQSDLYDSCLPSIVRGCKTKSGVQKRISVLSKFLARETGKHAILRKIDSIYYSPLYQHYGISTKWIDLVDNVWVAIWFGMHEFSAKSYEREYVYVRRRKPDDHFLYVLLVFIDAVESKSPGFYVGKEHDLVDLRTGAPSMFLRPHAQHGLLARCRGGQDIESNDFMRYVCGIIRVRLSDAYDWIGQGHLLTHINMFPSPMYDYGYAFLLEKTEVNIAEKATLGSIKLYTLS